MGTKKLETLQAQEHQEAMDLLRMADVSTNPAIAKIAASMAQERMRHQHSQASKISPGIAVLLATLIFVVSVMGCSFALVNYSQRVGLEISGVIVCLAILLVGFYALFSGHLNQANFMIIFKWAAAHLKSLLSRKHAEGISLNAGHGDEPSIPREK
jgi:hypothetical protein